MKHNITLGCIAAMLAVGVFYTFALCMVQDIEDVAVSGEQYAVMETAPPNENRAELREEKNEKAVKSDKKSSGTAVKAEAAGLAVDGGFAFNSASSALALISVSENTAPEKTSAEADNSAAEKKKADIPEASEERGTTEKTDEADASSDEGDGGDTAEASEKPVYAANNESAGDSAIFDAEDIEDAENYTETDLSVPEETEPEETAPPENEEPAEDTYLFNEDETVFDNIADYYPEASAENAEETSVSVNMNEGADISTSETFTAKINGSAQTVNAYDLICQIVANEMSPSFSDEALKAQAVAAYSYVKYHNVNGLTPSVLVKRDVPDRIKDIVSEVWGVCCYYNGSVAQTVYMASSSGYTADAENVWGGSVPYLKSVYCPFDADSDPNYGDTKDVSESSMRNMLESCLGITLSDDPRGWLVITDYVDGNYVGEISVDGQKTISGRKLRENVMGHSLKSAAFDVYYSDGYFHFTTYGYGHGVGMSQNGANILAKQGYSYVDILKYYFTGIEVQ